MVPTPVCHGQLNLNLNHNHNLNPACAQESSIIISRDSFGCAALRLARSFSFSTHTLYRSNMVLAHDTTLYSRRTQNGRASNPKYQGTAVFYPLKKKKKKNLISCLPLMVGKNIGRVQYSTVQDWYCVERTLVIAMNSSVYGFGVYWCAAVPYRTVPWYNTCSNNSVN